jgi:hypothetical protein
MVYTNFAVTPILGPSVESFQSRKSTDENVVLTTAKV